VAGSRTGDNVLRHIPLLALLYAPRLVAQATGERYVVLYEEVDHKPRMLKGGALFYPADTSATPGKVSLELVVDTTGLVNPGSIRVTTTPDPAVTAAAKATVLGARYRPGRLRSGLAVRVLMRQDLSFKAITVPCDSIVTVDDTRLCMVPQRH
jgi:hypothetical protein